MNRFNYQPHVSALQPLFALSKSIHASSIEPALRELVQMRVSQINGCAFCLDMHSKDARAAGETEQRLHLLPVWRETRLYSARERAALVVFFLAGVAAACAFWAGISQGAPIAFVLGGLMLATGLSVGLAQDANWCVSGNEAEVHWRRK